MAIVVATLLAACATTRFSPQAVTEHAFVKRGITKSDNDITVTAAVPSPDEFRQITGMDLYAKGIQPVWLSVVNDRDEPVRVAYASIDPDYFSPLEVAWLQRKRFRKEDRGALERWFMDNKLSRGIVPGVTRSGFVYTHFSEGTKGFNVDVYSRKASAQFTFFVPLPGFTPDYMDVDFANLYTKEDLVRTDPEGLRSIIAGLPCCTTDESGSRSGDPLNVVIVGTATATRRSLLRAGWQETESSADDTVLARRHRYRGRQPDGTFRHKRPDGDEVKELRLWLAPIFVDDLPVWLGSASYEMSGALFGHNPSRYKIDPDVDDARLYILQNFWYSQSLSMFAMASGGPVAPFDIPRVNFHGHEFFSDGLRAVMFVSEQPVGMDETEILNWEKFNVR